MRYAFIEQNRGSYPVQALCAALQVSDSGFAAWQRGEGPTKWLSDGELLKRIREIHEETKAAYGSPRIYQELKGRGIPVSKGRVERLMRENGLRGRHKRRFKATTDSKHSLPVAPNRLDQNFETERPDQVWTADITYLATGEGWLYLAIVLDLYTRQIVGWAMRERMTKDLVIDALRMAWFRRRPQPGLIHHSDRGSQYCSHDFQNQLTEYGMLSSMSRKGNCWDNATSESFFNSLKNERVHGTVTKLAMRHEPTCSTTSKFSITVFVATHHSAAQSSVVLRKLVQDAVARPSWRPEGYRLVPENPMEGHLKPDGKLAPRLFLILITTLSVAYLVAMFAVFMRGLMPNDVLFPWAFAIRCICSPHGDDFSSAQIPLY